MAVNNFGWLKNPQPNHNLTLFIHAIKRAVNRRFGPQRNAAAIVSSMFVTIIVIC